METTLLNLTTITKVRNQKRPSKHRAQVNLNMELLIFNCHLSKSIASGITRVAHHEQLKT